MTVVRLHGAALVAESGLAGGDGSAGVRDPGEPGFDGAVSVFPVLGGGFLRKRQNRA